MLNRRRFLAGSLLSTAAASLLPASNPPLLIDSHVHVWKHDPVFPFAPGAHPPPTDASAEQLLELMSANRVARTVLIQVIHYKWDNRYLADVLRRYPGRFHGVCRVDPENSNAPDQLSRLTEQHGFHGVRLSPAADPAGDWIRGPLMPRLWRRAALLKIPMTLLAPVTRIPDLIPLLDANPGLSVVIDHMADSPLNDPQKFDLLLALAKYPRLFVKISHPWSLSSQPFPYPDAMAQVQRLLAAFTARRLMWGTDWPISLAQLPYARAVELFRDHMPFLTPAEHQQILSRTAQQLWPFGF